MGEVVLTLDPAARPREGDVFLSEVRDAEGRRRSVLVAGEDSAGRLWCVPLLRPSPGEPDAGLAPEAAARLDRSAALWLTRPALRARVGRMPGAVAAPAEAAPRAAGRGSRPG